MNRIPLGASLSERETDRSEKQVHIMKNMIYRTAFVLIALVVLCSIVSINNGIQREECPAVAETYRSGEHPVMDDVLTKNGATDAADSIATLQSLASTADSGKHSRGMSAYATPAS